MKVIKIIILSSILFYSSTGFAADGCLINNRVYPSKVNVGLLNAVIELLFGSTNLYYNTSPAFSACGWTPKTTGVSCSVCDGTYTTTLGLISGCNGTIFTGGQQGVGFNIVQCNLDNYSWTLSAVAIFGFIIIRRKKIL